MKNNIIKSLFVCALAVAAAACTTDEVDNTLGYNAEEIVNEELNAALKELGYSFDENDELICDDKVDATKSLDLSDCGLKSMYGLAIFESLETVDLSNNDFGTSVNFRELPESIVNINLAGNESIETYNGLVMTMSGVVPRDKVKSVVFPKSVLWNMNEVIKYARTDVGEAASLTYIDENGKSQKYSVLRNVPDVLLKIKLREMYPSVFDAETGNIDISKPIEEKVDFILDEEYSNLEGIEYFLSNPTYRGATGRVVIRGSKDKHYNMTYIKPALPITSLSMFNVDTPNGIDLSIAVDLKSLRISNNASIESLEIPSVFMGSELSDAHITTNEICVEDCAELSTVTLPVSGAAIGKVQFSNLPNLKELDLHNIKTIHTMVLYDMASTNVVLPAILADCTDGWGGEPLVDNVYVALDDAVATSPAYASFQAMCKSSSIGIADLSAYYGLE